MANEEHLKILKQGVEAWNSWRKDNPGVMPDLSGADLHRAVLSLTDLSGADLSGADLSRANLYMANLRRTILSGANLSSTNLSRANLNNANLSGANLRRACLKEGSLSGANLYEADLSGTNLNGTNLSGAIAGWSTFAGIDLSAVKGLDAVKHIGPSTIGIDTIYRSKGNIPEVFLRGTGVPETFMTHIPSLVKQATPFYSCFVSYSSKDQMFVERLHTDLQDKGVPCWFAPEDMRIGDRIRPSIDQAVRSYDKLLLVLSEHSIDSDWVEKEVETAFEEERKRKRIILFPIRLDSAVMDTDQAWAADIRRTRHIGDFTRWKDHDAYQKAFDRLLRDLKAEEVAEAEA